MSLCLISIIALHPVFYFGNLRFPVKTYSLTTESSQSSETFLIKKLFTRRPLRLGGEILSELKLHRKNSNLLFYLTSWHAAQWLLRFASNSGSIERHFSTRIGQRGSRRQASGGFTGSVISPLREGGIYEENVAIVGFASNRALVYGCIGALKIFSTGAISIILPAYMTPTMSAR